MQRLSLVLLVGLSACSPYVFQTEVAKFSTGVDQLSDAFTAGYTTLAADHAALTQLQLTDTHAKVAIAPSCDVQPSALPQSQLPCELYRWGDPVPAPSKVQSTKADVDKAISALRNYAHALSAVANAADRAAFDAAVTQLSGAVGDIAKAANAVAPGAGTIAPAAINLAGWVVGAALDTDRLDALKQAVNACDGPVHGVATTLGIGLGSVANASRDLLNQEASLLVSPLGASANDATYKSRYVQAMTIIASINAIRQNDPDAAAKSLSDAHHALVGAVNDPKREYAGLVKAIGDFVDKAAALNAALNTPPAKKS